MRTLSEIPYKIEVGTRFEHNNQGVTREYTVLSIIPAPSERHHDCIEIMNVRTSDVYEIEPEWFNQRKIRIIEQKGQVELF